MPPGFSSWRGRVAGVWPACAEGIFPRLVLFGGVWPAHSWQWQDCRRYACTTDIVKIRASISNTGRIVMHLSGKAALVTGASSGIGRATALLLAEHGAKLALVDIAREPLHALCDEMKAKGLQAVACEADVSVAEQVQAAVAKAVGAWGRLDIVFSNAGINGTWAPLEVLTPQEWDTTLGINLRGGFLTLKYTIPHLRVRGGSIIIDSSINGTRVFSNVGAAAYASSKAALAALGKMAALELAPYKIRVNVICPGSIVTQIDAGTKRRGLDDLQPQVIFPRGEIPLTSGKPGTAEQVARLVAFLASDESDHISGTEVYIDAAQSLLRG